MKDYKETLDETVDNLINVKHQLFENLVNIAMSNELIEINEVFEEGDVYSFELSHFEGSSDVNVNILVELIKKVEQTLHSICSLNNIEVGEKDY